MVRPLTLSSRLSQDRLFGFGIDAGKSVIEHDDRRVYIEQSRDRDALLLAAGERHAAFADDSVEPMRHNRDVAVESRDARGLLDFVQRRVGVAEGNVARDACRKRASAPAGPSRRSCAGPPSGKSRMSRPSSRMRPLVGSIRRASNLTMVDLPEPVRPTIASLPPAGTLTLMPRKAQCCASPVPLVPLTAAGGTGLWL